MLSNMTLSDFLQNTFPNLNIIGSNTQRKVMPILLRQIRNLSYNINHLDIIKS